MAWSKPATDVGHLLDLVGAEAELGHHLGGVLAEQRRRPADAAARRVAEVHDVGDDAGGADAGHLDVGEVAVGGDLRIGDERPS